jgi:hypothetical protein
MSFLSCFSNNGASQDLPVSVSQGALVWGDTGPCESIDPKLVEENSFFFPSFRKEAE